MERSQRTQRKSKSFLTGLTGFTGLKNLEFREPLAKCLGTKQTDPFICPENRQP
jgi:hypothetical protein